MLLSDVLYIAKNLNSLNEAYKSNILRTIFQRYEYSSITLNPEYIDNKNTWRKAEPLTSYEICDKYCRLYRNNELTQESLDDPKQREKLMNIKYVKNKYYDYNNTTFIKHLLNKIVEKTNTHIGISEITDETLIKITPEDAKKKPYKNNLQFWFTYDNELKAICKDNKIIALIVKNYDSWYKSNPEYKGTTDIELFEHNYYSYDLEKKIKEEFISKAFIEIPVFKLMCNPNLIKQELGANNIKTLMTKELISYVYTVNDEGMENINYDEIIKQRQDYIKYLNSQKDLADKNHQRYLNEIKYRKEHGTDNKIQDFVNNAYDIIFDAYNDMQQFMFKYLSDNIEKYIIKYAQSINILYDTKYAKLKTLLPENVYEGSRGYSRRYKQPYEEFYVKTIGDCFIVINLYFENLLNDFQFFINTLNTIQELKKDTEKNKDVILSNLKYLKDKYNLVIKNINYNNDNVLSTVVYILKQVQINPEPILSKLMNVQKITI